MSRTSKKSIKISKLVDNLERLMNGLPEQNWKRYLFALSCVAVCTTLAWIMHGHLAPANLIMVYLLGVVWTATLAGRGPAIMASLAGVAVFDFFFVKPYLSFAVFESPYLVTLSVMLIIAFMISALTARIKQQAEESLLLSQQAQAEKLRSSLLSSVSHDLRTPLATITGAASGIIEANGLPNHRAVELAQVVYEEGERMERLVTNLLSMTRLQSGQVTVNRQWLPLEEIVGSALAAMDKRLSSRSLAVTLDEDLPLIPVDAIMVEQVFVNLLDNAVKHTGSDSAIGITAESTAGQVTVTIYDTGRGIALKDSELIFENFYQAHSNGSTSRSGSGMGLFICRSIINAHGGRIWLEPNTPTGCKFIFTLPIIGTAPTITLAEEVNQSGY